MELKILQTLTHSKKSKETNDKCMTFHRCSVFFHAVLQTANCILNSLICTAIFSNNFNSIFNKKIEKLFCICADSMLKKEEQIAYLEYSLLITKIHHMSH